MEHEKSCPWTQHRTVGKVPPHLELCIPSMQIVPSRSGKSVQSNASSASASAIKARANEEAARARAKFAQKEAVIRAERARIEGRSRQPLPLHVKRPNWKQP